MWTERRKKEGTRRCAPASAPTAPLHRCTHDQHARAPQKTRSQTVVSLLRTVFLEFSGQVLPAPRRRRAAQQSCQDTTSHLLTTSQLQSSRHASCRHHSSCYDQRRRHLARQGPVCNVTITMSASSIAQRQTCCQATASWFVDEYGT